MIGGYLHVLQWLLDCPCEAENGDRLELHLAGLSGICFLLFLCLALLLVAVLWNWTARVNWGV
jgi:hypothetical protein